MLLTLTANSLRSLLARGKSGKAKLELADLPAFARDQLGLHGLNLGTDLLAGVSREGLEKLRERADKAGCACLLLIESEPQPFGDPSEAAGPPLIERLTKVVQAANLLGCSSVAVKVAGRDDPAAVARAAERLRKAVVKAEKLELNVLLSPHDGMTATPERVTELLKKVGGFRVGTYPDFQAAAASPDPAGYLRRLTPYAAMVSASTVKFSGGTGDDEGEEAPLKHTPYDLKPLVEAIVSVGYDGTLAIDYRGTGDAKLGVVRSRRALEQLLSVDAGGEAGEDEPDEE
jgi:sugar phosphate isomerase/epimerase